LGNSSHRHRLTYIDVLINGYPARAMVDTGATHSFIAVPEANRVKLQWGGDKGKMKTVNARATETTGLAKERRTHENQGLAGTNGSSGGPP